VSGASLVRRSSQKRALSQFAAAACSCAILAASAFLHIHARTRVTEQGYRLSRLSAEHQKLLHEHDRLQLQAAQLESPQRLSDLSRARLGMGPAGGDRMVVLVSGAPGPGAFLAAE
jgi:cell division protein FtsL